MKLGVPSFVFQIFGSDNVFNFIETYNRHNKGIQLMNDIGSEVIGFATDGDARYTKVGLMKSKIGGNNEVPEFLKIFFDADLSCHSPYFQDMDHISNKGTNH